MEYDLSSGEVGVESGRVYPDAAAAPLKESSIRSCTEARLVNEKSEKSVKTTQFDSSYLRTTYIALSAVFCSPSKRSIPYVETILTKKGLV